MIQKSTALERSVKYFTGGLKPVSQRANLTLSSDLFSFHEWYIKHITVIDVQFHY